MLEPFAVLLVPFCAVTVLGGCYHTVGSAGSQGSGAAAERVRWLARVSESLDHQASPDGGAACTPASEATLTARAAAAVRAETEAEARWALALADAPREANPEIRIGTSSVEDFNLQRGGVRFGLRAPFARPGTLAAARDALIQEAEATRWAGREREREATRDTALAAARQAAAAALVEVAREFLAGAENELARLLRGQAAHAVLATTLAEAESERAAATADLAGAEADRDAWRARVAALAGGCGEVQADPAAWAGEAAVAIDERATIEAALAARPRLAERQTQRFAAEARMYEARAAAWPWLEWVQVEWEKETEPSPAAWSFGLAIEVPIFAWGGGAIAASEAELRYIDEAAGREARTVKDEVAAAAGMLRTQKDRVARVEAAEKAIDRARLATLERGAEAGTVDPADVWKIKRLVLALERQRIEGLLALREAQITLAHAIGATAP